MGEGGHNYHHTFPQDYRTSEYVLHFNVTKLFIDILFYLGLAYDMKVVPQEVISIEVGGVFAVYSLISQCLLLFYQTLLLFLRKGKNVL